MHRLRVQGFLGIQDAELLLDGLTVLIGAQASGKSVVARLVYFFNEYFADFNISAISSNEHKRAYDRRKRDEFYGIFPRYSWEASEFTITYHNERHEVKICSGKNSSVIDIQTSPSVSSYFRSLKNTYKKFVEVEKEDDSIFGVRFAFRRYLAKSELIQYESALFVPAARSFYATIRDEIFSILALDAKIDHIILKFGEFYENAKAQIWRNPRQRQYIHSSRYFKQVLMGNFIRESGQDWLEMKHGRIELSRASSGQQEALPLLVSILQFPRRNRTLIIEEPEAHLFPEAQIEVLNFMIRQLRRRGGSIMFTTHSPYLLSSLNNHLLAYEKEKSRGISVDNVRAYSIDGGCASSLVDMDIGLISADYIDKVSEKIAGEFEEFLEVE